MTCGCYKKGLDYVSLWCAIPAGRAEASVVFEDDVVMVFMDVNPVTQDHLLVVPRSQTVFHFHLHVIPRYAGDGWRLKSESQERARSRLDDDARVIRNALGPFT